MCGVGVCVCVGWVVGLIIMTMQLMYVQYSMKTINRPRSLVFSREIIFNSTVKLPVHKQLNVLFWCKLPIF